MAETTKISWTHSTFNGWIGCTKVSEGCEFCYAKSLMDDRYGRVVWGPGKARSKPSEAYWKEPLRWQRDAVKRQADYLASVGDPLRLAYLEGERRRRKLFKQGDLARVHVFSRRLPRMNRHGYEGKVVASKLAFAWFVWQRDHSGPPSISFLDWKEHQ